MPAPAPARRVLRSAERWRAVVQASVEHDTPLGRLGLAASATGLCAVLFPEPSPRPVPLSPVPLSPVPLSPVQQSPVPHSPVQQPPKPPRDASRWLAQAQRELDRYFAGRLRTFTVPLDLQGTPFQFAVWQGLRQIPFGDTLSYGALAAAVGCPRASRAVGQANHLNPVAIIVPCHRVIGADGSLTGYGGGLDRKQYLLRFESNPPPAGGSPSPHPAARASRASPAPRRD